MVSTHILFLYYAETKQPVNVTTYASDVVVSALSESNEFDGTECW